MKEKWGKVEQCNNAIRKERHRRTVHWRIRVKKRRDILRLYLCS